MSISFSGLASGLDTSSWIEQLVALKRAKVTTYQQQKENVLLSRNTLNSIKTFFSSFRSTIERITDTKFNVASMDLFAQNIAKSSNLNVVSATASSDADEGVYKVKVDKLATKTSATSGIKRTNVDTTPTQATYDTKLKDIGINAGTIGVTSNGVQHGIALTESDTISTLLEKLRNVGIDANFNNNTGKFSIDVGVSDIVDNGTNFKTALHLSGVNEGYKTNTSLVIEKEETEFEIAKNDTELGELRVTAGNLAISAHGTEYDVEITTGTKIGELVSALNANGIEATFDENTGIFSIKDAEIIDADTDTNIKDIFGLTSEVYEKKQTSTTLTDTTVVDTGTGAGDDSLLSEFGINSAQTLTVHLEDGTTETIDVDGSTSLGTLVTELNSTGVTATLSGGVLSIDNGYIENAALEEALGLEKTESYYSKIIGDEVTYTVTVTTGTEATSTLGVTYTSTVNADSSTTLEQLGIVTSQSPHFSSIVTQSTQAEAEAAGFTWVTTRAELEQALSENKEDIMLGADIDMSGEIWEGVGDSYDDTNFLNVLNGNGYVIKNMTSTTGLFHFLGEATIVNLGFENITISNDGTDGTFGNVGAIASQMSGGYIINCYVANSSIETTVNTANSGNAGGLVGATENGCCSISNSNVFNTTVSGKFAGGGVGLVYSSSYIEVDNVNISGSTISSNWSAGGLVGGIANSGISSNINSVVVDSVVTSSSGNDDTYYGAIVGCADNAVLISNSFYSSDISLNVYGAGSSATVTLNQVDSSSTLGKDLLIHNYAGEIIGGIDVSGTTSINKLFNELSTYGITGSLENGVISLYSSDGNYITGDVATQLGIGTVSNGTSLSTTGLSQTSSSAITYIQTLTADSSTTLGELGVNSYLGSSIQVYNANGEVVNAISLTADSTLGELCSALNENGINATLSNGVISIASNDKGKYVEGAVLEELGISKVENGTTIVTVGTTFTSSAAVTYTVTTTATGTTTLGSLGLYDNKPSKFVSAITQLATATDGYTMVTTAEGLNTALNNGENVILGADIDFEDVSWTSIASYSGKLDGNGYVIKNFTGTGGLFATLEAGATITNLGIENANITSSGNVGLLANEVSGDVTINNCYVNLSNVTSSSNVGGLIGNVSSANTITVDNTNILNSDFTGNLVGGIIGSTTSSVFNISIDNTKIYNSNIEGESISGGFVAQASPNSTTAITQTEINAIVQGGTSGVFVGSNNMTLIIENSNYYTGGASNLVGSGSYNTSNVEATLDDCIEEYLPDFVIYDNTNTKICEFDLSADATVNDLVSKLESYSIGVSLTADGKLNFSPWAGGNVKSVSGFVGSKRTYGISAGEGSIDLNKYETKTLSSITTLAELLGGETASITVVQDGVEYLIDDVAAEFGTISSFVNFLNNHGINAQVGSKISVTSYDNAYIKDMSSELKEALNLSGGFYTQNSVTAYKNTSSSTLTFSEETPISRETSLDDINGMDLSAEVTIVQGGTESSFFIKSYCSTVGEMVDFLNGKGLTCGVSADGKLTISGNENAYIKDATSAFASAFNLSFGEDLSYDSTSTELFKNTASSQLTHEITNTLSLDTTFAELGATANMFITVNQDGTEYTITVEANYTLENLKDVLDNKGVALSVVAGKAILTPSAGTFISDISDDLCGYLNLDPDATYYGVNETNYSLVNSTTLSDIGIAEGEILVSKNGQVAGTISIGSTSTLQDFRNQLTALGVDSSVANGQLTIESDKNILSFAPNGDDGGAIAKLGLDNTPVSATTAFSQESTGLAGIETITIAATSDTTLAELGVTTGEYYIYNNGVKHTAYISSNETLGSFISTLEGFGMQVGLKENGATSTLTIGANGNSYISKSLNTANASNVVEKLFPADANETFAYTSKTLETSSVVTTETSVTEDTLLSTFDNGVLKSEGTLSVNIDGITSNIQITADETIGTFLDKLESVGLNTTLTNDGKIIIESGFKEFSVNPTPQTSSNVMATLGLNSVADLGGYSASSQTVMQSNSIVTEETLSASKHANGSTKMSSLGITSGTFTIYKDGEKFTYQLDANEDFDKFNSDVNARFANVYVGFEDGHLKIYSSDPNVKVEVGSTTDTSNLSAIVGLSNDASGVVKSARELYCVSAGSVITTAGIFEKGTVRAGTFMIGDATFTIENTTTISDIVSQINASQDANVTAYWDSVDGKLVLQSRTTGSALINIEAGSSNFTDILGFTESTWANPAANPTSTKMLVNTQEVGENARFSINGTYYTSTKNEIGSDISRINGLTINLKGISNGEETITVDRDTDNLADAVSDVVDAYNQLIENIDSEIAQDAPLNDQTALKYIRNQIRSLMTGSLGTMTTYKSLQNVGITLNEASATDISVENINKLTFDKEKFISAYSADRDALKNLLVGTETNQGVLTRIENVLENALTGVSGFFASAEKSYNTQISRLNDKISKTESAVDRYRVRLEKKFESMDLLISQMQNQYSSFLGL